MSDCAHWMVRCEAGVICEKCKTVFLIHKSAHEEQVEVRRDLELKGVAVMVLDAVEKSPGLGMVEVVGKIERAAIEMALEECGGVKAQAAQKLRMLRTTLVERCKRYGL